MPACEKCWADAYRRELTSPMKSQAEHYHDLIKERENNPCTPEQQKYGYDKPELPDNIETQNLTDTLKERGDIG